VSLDYTELSDGELAALSLAGRQIAFAEIVRRHREPLYRIIVANVADADEALDLVQESFVAAYRALRHYDAARPMRGWLITIALNKCRDWARRRKVRRIFSFALPLDGAAEAIAEDRPLHDIEAADREELARTRRAIAGLPTTLREVLVLRAIDGQSQAEAAAILGVTEKAVETRLRRARAKLSERLDRDPR
jgi:RNA polymerase sigma-70 factor (ECF subfamily)